MSIPSDQFSHIAKFFITHTNIHLKKIMDNTCYLLQKQT